MSKAELRKCKSLSHRQLLRNRKCEVVLHKKEVAAASKHKRVKALTKAELRRCHSMTYRQLLRHRDCAAQLQTELNAGEHAKHRHHDRKAVRHKTAGKRRRR